jgi:hypothetical protein
MRTHFTALALAVSLAGVSTVQADAKKYNIVIAGDQKYSPVDPKNEKGLQMAVVSGDPKTGPVSFYLKLPKGPAPIHYHTSDYTAVVLEGKTKHWLPGKEAEAKEGGAGTAWFQPGGATGAHGDECLSDTCVIFIVMPKKFDFFPAKVDAKKDTKAPPAKK